MGQIFVSIKPFEDDTGLTYADDFIDVSEDVIMRGLSPIKRWLDNTELDIGIFRHADFNIELNNTDGTYNRAGTVGSIFNHRRNNSIVRIEWEYNSDARPLGFHPAGNFKCSPRQLIGDFLLNDKVTEGGSIEQNTKFKCIGLTTLFDKAEVPFDDIDNGDTYSEVIFKCLDQASITKLLTVAQVNIVVANDDAIDDKTLGDLENKTVTATLKKLLPFCNSVLYLEGSTVKVSNRSPSATVLFTFTGPGSLVDIENIDDIQKIKDGDNQIINQCTIRDTTIVKKDEASIARAGVGLRPKELEFKPVSDTTKNETACQAIVDEFKDEKVELLLLTELNYNRLDLTLLDRVDIDYPDQVLTESGGVLPIFDIAEFDIAEFPVQLKDVQLPVDAEYKILAITTDLRKETIIFALREI